MRALTAEALLSARETHHTEMWSLSHTEDLKRNVSTFQLTFNGYCIERGT